MSQPTPSHTYTFWHVGGSWPISNDLPLLHTFQNKTSTTDAFCLNLSVHISPPLLYPAVQTLELTIATECGVGPVISRILRVLTAVNSIAVGSRKTERTLDRVRDPGFGVFISIGYHGNCELTWYHVINLKNEVCPPLALGPLTSCVRVQAAISWAKVAPNSDGWMVSIIEPSGDLSTLYHLSEV